MVKGNRHPFWGQEILFVTKHKKETILASLFVELGLSLRVADVDTDLYGTFSGEVERPGTAREALRAKIKAAIHLYPNTRFFLASEGSFAPHPIIGLVQSDLESLLLFDRAENIEVYAESISTIVIHDEIAITHFDELESFLKKNQFPTHALIVRPSTSFDPIFKGIKTESNLRKSLSECIFKSENGRAIVATDLRAHHNPTRQKVIYNAGLKLIESLKSLCPQCDYPGFRIVNGIPGLPCRDCGHRSAFFYKVLLECGKCCYSEERKRPDGVLSIGPEECEICNP